jgi:hypothetical protein
MHMQNAIIRLDFDESTGSISQITDRVSGRRFLQDPRGARLAKLIVPTPTHNSRPLYSHEAGRPDLKRSGDTLTISFPELRDQEGGETSGVFLTVRVRLPSGSPQALFTAEIRNMGPYRVNEMWFPWLGGRRGSPGRLQDTITTSQASEKDIYGRLYQSARSPHAFGHHQHRVSYAFPLPMMDLSTAGGGLSYNKYEPNPSPHVLVFENPQVERDDLCMTWSWVTYVFAEPGQTWTSCEFGIGVHQGDWHQTADLFRQWLQTWRKPCDTPQSVREKIGLLHIQAHGFSGQPYHEFSDLPAIAADALAFGVNDLLVWDPTASVYYRPDRGGFWEMPDERRLELERSLADIRALGCSVSTYVNWCLAAELNSTWPELLPLVQESIFGIHQYGFPGGSMDGCLFSDPNYEMGTHSVCCGSDGYPAYADAVLDKTLELGFDAVAIDMASEWKYCMSSKHGHASPWEAWARTYEWYSKTTRTVRARNPTAYTIAELPDLYNTQHIDFWWNWGWSYPSHSNPSVFKYLLPEMTIAWCLDENQMDIVAEAFAYGSFLAVATRDMTGRLSDAPELAAQIGRLARLRKATAAYLCRGRFLDDHGLRITGGKGFLYRSKEGLAVALANGSKRAARLEVTLDLSLFEDFRPMDCQLYLENSEIRNVRVRRQGNTWSCTANLPARQAGVLLLPGQWIQGDTT